MGTCFCPYTGELVDLESSSLEHIIPESLGGTKAFAITVKRQANNSLGAEVDEAVVDLYLHRRMKFDLRGHSGKAPSWAATVKVNDLAGHMARWEVTQAESQLRLRPQVTKERLPDGRTSVTVSGDPAQATAIFEDLKRAHEARGKTVQLLPSAAAQRIEQPTLTAQLRFDLVALGRFPLKIALGVGHWLWGEDWSRGSDAHALRRALWSTTMPALTSAAGERVATLAPTDLGLRVEEAEHGFFVSRLPDGTGALGIFPFGQQGWIVKLGAIPAGEPLMVILDVRARTVRRLSSAELLAEARFRLTDELPAP